jgi:hypothetical protein
LAAHEGQSIGSVPLRGLADVLKQVTDVAEGPMRSRSVREICFAWIRNQSTPAN